MTSPRGVDHTLSRGMVATTPPTPAPAVGDRVAAHLFFLFFVAQILSPSYLGVTIYLEVVIAALTPSFWRWVTSLVIPTESVVAFFMLCSSLIIARPLGVVEVFSLVVSVLYLVHTYVRGHFFLFRYLALSILVAVTQFLLVRIDPTLATSIGPERISEAVWGSHATATNTNFYAVIGGVERVSGLSREAGFFASLVVLSAVVFWLGERENMKLKVIAMPVAWVVSLSKMSFVVLPLFLIIALRRSLDALPWPVAVGSFVGLCAIGVSTLEAFIMAPDNGTFLHRFGGYLVVDSMTPLQLLRGSDLSQVDAPEARLIAAQFDQAAGLSGFFISNGGVVVALVFLLLATLGARSTALLVICVGSINVDPLTSQNFVSLTYFLSLYLLPASPPTATHPRNVRACKVHGLTKVAMK